MGLFGVLLGRIRCPWCGVQARHPRDLFREKEIRTMLECGFDPLALLGEKTIARAFVCQNCGYHFDLNSALEWDKIARKLGNERTIREFRKLKDGKGGE